MIVTKYDMVATKDRDIFVQNVNGFLSRGWQLHGPMHMAMANNGKAFEPVETIFVQAVVRTEERPNEILREFD